MDVGGAWGRAHARVQELPGVRQFLRLQRRFAKDAGGYLAAALSYFFFLSVLPLLLLAMSIAGFALTHVSHPDLVRELERIAREVPGIGTLLERNLNALVGTRTVTAVVGVLGILWTGSGGIAAIRRTLGSVFRFSVPMNSLTLRARSLGVFFLVGPLVLASTAAIGIAIGLGLERWWLAVVALVIGLALNVLIAGSLFRGFTPPEVVPTADHWPGAISCGVGFTLIQALGSAYFVRVVRHASLFFGAFAGVVGTLVIFNLTARVFLYGAEITAIRLESRRDGRGDQSPRSGRGS